VFNISELKSIKDFNENMLMVFIVSTYGEGGPTDDSVDFNILIKNRLSLVLYRNYVNI
jgi:sulfite reductase alpha subunit-like flavoprotein